MRRRGLVGEPWVPPHSTNEIQRLVITGELLREQRAFVLTGVG